MQLQCLPRMWSDIVIIFLMKINQVLVYCCHLWSCFCNETLVTLVFVNNEMQFSRIPNVLSEDDVKQRFCLIMPILPLLPITCKQSTKHTQQTLEEIDMMCIKARGDDSHLRIHWISGLRHIWVYNDTLKLMDYEAKEATALKQSLSWIRLWGSDNDLKRLDQTKLGTFLLSCTITMDLNETALWTELPIT